MKSTFLIWGRSTGTPNLVSRVSRALGVIAVLFTLSVASFTTASAVELKSDPTWCKPGYRCLADDDYAALTEQYLEVRGQYRKLRWQKDAPETVRD